LNFQFLSPLFLLGLATTIIPLIAHLISKRRHANIKKRFSAVSFILASQAEGTKRSHITDLLLLLIRVFILVSIVIVFSKPAFFSFLKDVGSNETKSVAIVIDNSLSMSYGNNLELAKKKAKDIIYALNRSSLAAVIPLVSTNNALPAITSDKKKLLKAVDNIKPSYSFTDNQTRIEEVFNLLQRTHHKTKEVIMITDLQRNGWKDEEFKREWFIPIDISEKNKLENHAVSNIEFEYREDSIKIAVEVSNFSKAPVKNLLTKVILNGKEANRVVDIAPRAREKKDFLFIGLQDTSSLPEITGKVQTLNDNLEIDDTRYFVIPKVGKPNILIVNGDPSEDPRLSETFYIVRALETLSEVTEFRLHIKSNDDFLSEELDKYKLIILANTGYLSPQKAHEIERFLNEGGSVIVFLGSQIRANVYNMLLGNTLPAKIEDTVEGDFFLRAKAPLTFLPDTEKRLKQVKVNKLFNTLPNKDSGIIFYTSNDMPFLLKKNIKNGIVYMFTSTADTAWTNLPITPVFVPVIKYILDSSLTRVSEKRNFLVGETVDINLKDDIEEVTVKTPYGENLKVTRRNPIFYKTLVPGIYRVEYRGKHLYSFAVNPDPRESDLEKISFQLTGSSENQIKPIKVVREIGVYFIWLTIAMFTVECLLKNLNLLSLLHLFRGENQNQEGLKS
jgi:hypothetical protein